MAVTFVTSCDSSTRVRKANLSDDNPTIFKCGDFDLSLFKIDVTYANGVNETISATEEMIRKSDLDYFYKVGEWTIHFEYSIFTLSTDITVVLNEFSDLITLPNQEILYDGEAHGLTVEGPVPSGTKIYYPEGNSFVESSKNPYQITAILSKEGYANKTLKGELIINESNYDYEKYESIVFDDAIYTFDGNEKIIEVKNLPDDLTVKYFFKDSGEEGNRKINCGKYTVVAKFTSKNHNLLPPPNLEADLIINKANHDISKLEFKDATFTYDGNPHMVLATGLEAVATNIREHYFVEGQDQEIDPKVGIADAGVYNIRVDFEVGTNFNPIESLHSVLTINKKTLDLSKISYNLQEVTFDNEKHEYEGIEGVIPEEITPIFEYYKVVPASLEEPDGQLLKVDEMVEPGEYEIYISYKFKDGFKESNYELINVSDRPGILIIKNEE